MSDGGIDVARESAQGQAILRAHEPWLELARETHGIVLTNPGTTELGKTDIPSLGIFTWEVDTPPVPSLSARLLCGRRHVIGYVVDTTGSVDALLYVKLTETLDQLREQAAVHLGPEAPFNARGSLEARAVTCRLDPKADGARPAWCGMCKRQHHVDLALINAQLRQREREQKRRPASSLDVSLPTTSL